jgi:ABC-type phosphate/phosphonate transport system permease subunit
MNGKIPNQRTWLNLISAIILLVGLGSATLIYQRTGNETYGALGYESPDGTIYPIMPGDSKLYRHNLEVYGGKFNVIMDDFRRWFVGLWQGKSLAFIIACTTIIISFAFFYVANHLTHPLKFNVHNENNPDGTG